MTLLRMEHVNAYYGKVQALYDVSLIVEEGEIVALLGSNGAGKSTTLRCISGLAKPSSGQIWFDDASILKLKPNAIASKGISHVPEGRRIFPNLTVAENLFMGAYSRRKDRNAATAYNQRLAFIGELFPRLQERLSQKGKTLSGGEQQMLAIGRGLMMNPRILLLDEPSMGLSPLLCDHIFTAIERLNRDRGLTILLVEQNANLALSVAHRGYLIQQGSMVLSGTVSDLLQNNNVRSVYLGA